MAFEAIQYEVQGSVALLTLNRPERLNAINDAFRADVEAAMAHALADDAVRALVMTGAGRGFCAGAAHVASAGGQAAAPSQADKLDDVLWMGRWALMLQAFDKPLIAAVNGVAAGGGMGLALAADIRIGSDQTRFKTVFAERALGPDCGVSYFLPRIVGYSRAADLLLTSRMVDADEAYRLGLLDRLVPHDNLVAEAMALAAQIAEGPLLGAAHRQADAAGRNRRRRPWRRRFDTKPRACRWPARPAATRPRPAGPLSRNARRGSPAPDNPVATTCARSTTAGASWERPMDASKLMFKPGLMQGERILVTGGGSGLGKEMAEAFLSLGARVVICGRRGELLTETAKELTDRWGGEVLPIPCDIRSSEAVAQMVEDI